MSMPNAGSRGESALAEINVTPLIDVMLVLLVVFMIGLPAATSTLRLDLPQPRPVPEVLAPPPPVVLGIDDLGRLSWDGVVMEFAQVDWQLRQAGRAPQEITLVVEPTSRAPYRELTRVLALARNAGIERIGFRH
ncbi:MAG: biopolymer transporter ExbD [Xanthomonadales bacterium]|nr:biopolymer transporter ExbD [Xanthomonadales bacterium]